MTTRRRVRDVLTLSGLLAAAGGVAKVAGVAGVVGVAGVAGLGGCTSPLDARQGAGEQELRKSIISSARRELGEAERTRGGVETSRRPRIADLQLTPRVLDELEKTSGVNAYRDQPTPLGESLLGLPQESVGVNLERVMATTVSNNLTVQFARLTPAIDEARLVVAQAAFDWSLFGSTQWNAIDEQRINSQAIIPQPTFDERQVITASAGLRRRLTTGGTFTVQQSLEYQYNTTEGQNFFPNPANTADLTVQLDQPLLRNFGSDVALASVRLAENAERDQIQQLKTTLLDTLTQAETAYWNLVRAHGELKISQQLLDRGIKVRDVLKQRQEFDTNPSQYAASVAAVESRRGSVLQAENTLRSSSDQLKLLMNDEQLTIGSELLVLPVDVPTDAPVKFSLLDCITTALANRPEIQRAILAIDDASIRQVVADNARLPLLDLRAAIQFNALEDSPDEAISAQAEARLINYLVGLQFEQPLGNRGAEASARGRRLERMQTVIVYRDAVRRIIGELKSALRDVDTNYKLIEQRRAARVSAAEELRTLEVRERTLQALTPEFLDLKLRRQEALAGAEIQELTALTQYQVSLARLYSAMGTALERNRIDFQAPTLQQAVNESIGK
jgi:outer membrane protein